MGEVVGSYMKVFSGRADIGMSCAQPGLSRSLAVPGSLCYVLLWFGANWSSQSLRRAFSPRRSAPSSLRGRIA